ncbi:hypothetical protein BFW41_04415 [Aeromonas hydrophila]|nr:hypothetical protein BFW41_04415 [Aeromonas hydrophila]
MGRAGGHVTEGAEPQTGCWAGMIPSFADKLTGKRMRNAGKKIEASPADSLFSLFQAEFAEQQIKK